MKQLIYSRKLEFIHIKIVHTIIMSDFETNRNQFDFEETESELNKIKILRPLEIGYERLPEGVTALDFLEYTPVRSVKTFKYHPDDLPKHPLLGDLAVPSVDVVETQLKPHSEFYREVFKDKYGQGRLKTPPVTEEETIPWHLVREEEHATTFDRYKKKESFFKDIGEAEDVYNKIKAGEPLSFINGLNKLHETVDWLAPGFDIE